MILTEDELNNIADVLIKTLNDYKLNWMKTVDGDAYPLVDFLTPDKMSINIGKDVIEDIVDCFFIDLQDALKTN
jgi:hypothetical protein